MSSPEHSPRYQSAGKDGFSLIELLIATAVTGMILTLLSQMLLQSYRLSTAATSALEHAVTELTQARLRSDVSEARSIALSLDWSTDPLALRLNNSVVHYSLEEGYLYRRETTEHEDEEVSVTEQRLSPMQSFRWFSDGSETVWLEWREAETQGEVTNDRVVSPVERGLFKEMRPAKQLFLSNRERRSRSW